MKKKIISVLFAVLVLSVTVLSNVFIIENSKAQTIYEFSQTQTSSNGYISSASVFPYDVSITMSSFTFDYEIECQNWVYDDRTTQETINEIRYSFTRSQTPFLKILSSDGQYIDTNIKVPMGCMFDRYYYGTYNNAKTLIVVLKCTYVLINATLDSVYLQEMNCLPVFKFETSIMERQSIFSSVLQRSLTFYARWLYPTFTQARINFSFVKKNTIPFPVQSIRMQSKFGFYDTDIQGIPQNNYTQKGDFYSDNLEINDFPATSTPTYANLNEIINLGNFVYSNFPRSLKVYNSNLSFQPFANGTCFIVDFSEMNLFARAQSQLVVGVGSQLADYQVCEWYDIPCHLGNAFVYFMYEFPLTKPIVSFLSSGLSILSLPFEFLGKLSSMTIFPYMLLVFCVAFIFYVFK